MGDPKPTKLIASAGTHPSAFIFPAALSVGAILAATVKCLVTIHHVPWITEKSSFLNQYFAKWAWLWTTIVFGVAVVRSTWSRERKLAAGVRYCLATFYWVALTQWFWGAPILDRLFVFTGGRCSSPSHEVHPTLRRHYEDFGSVSSTMRECRSHGGVWEGGHDISGHCLLLVHSFLFLHLEFLTLRVSFNGVRHRRRSSSSHRSSVEIHGIPPQGISNEIVNLIKGLSLVWCVLLAITVVYYHELPELFNGIVLGTLFCAVVYSPSHMQD
jgi:hypothetical protein